MTIKNVKFMGGDEDKPLLDRGVCYDEECQTNLNKLKARQEQIVKHIANLDADRDLAVAHLDSIESMVSTIEREQKGLYS